MRGGAQEDVLLIFVLKTLSYPNWIALIVYANEGVWDKYGSFWADYKQVRL